VSTLKRQLTEIIGDVERAQRILESASLVRELDVIAKKYGGVPAVKPTATLTKDQRAASDKVRHFMRRYVKKYWHKESFVSQQPDRLHPVELVAYYAEARNVVTFIKILECAISNTLQHDDEAFRRSSIKEKLEILSTYEPLASLKEMRELFSLWILLAEDQIDQQSQRIARYQPLLKSLDAGETNRLRDVLTRLYRMAND
jgi:hypothetical protein